MKKALKALLLAYSLFAVAAQITQGKGVHNDSEYEALCKRCFYQLAASQPKLAQETADQAIKLNPKDYYAWSARSQSNLELRNYKQSVADATKAISLAPKNKINTSLLIRSEAEQALGQFDAAITDLNSIHPENGLMLHYQQQVRAKCYCLNDQSEKAIPDLSSLIAARPSDCLMATLRSTAYAATGRLEDATIDLERATTWRLRTGRPMVENGVLPKKYNSALYRSLRSLADRKIAAHKKIQDYFYRAFLNLILEDYDACSADCQKALALNDKLSQAYVLEGLAAIHKENSKLALAKFKQAISVAPNAASGYRGVSILYLSLQKLDHALPILTELIKNSPKNPVPIAERAQVYADLQKYKEAIADFDAAIKLRPNYASAYYGRAQVKESSDNLKGAIDDYSKVIALDGTQPQYRIFRSICYFETGQYDSALTDLNVVLETVSSQKLYYARASCYSKLGLSDLAKKDNDSAHAFDDYLSGAPNR